MGVQITNAINGGHVVFVLHALKLRNVRDSKFSAILSCFADHGQVWLEVGAKVFTFAKLGCSVCERHASK